MGKVGSVTADGAFYEGEASGWGVSHYSGSTAPFFRLNANKNSWIYGNSDTVHPESMRIMYMIKF